MANRIDGATVQAYALNVDGTLGEAVSRGEVTTDADGHFLIKVFDRSTPVILVATGGSYTDEATGESIEMGSDTLRTALPDVTAANDVAITPVTELAVQSLPNTVNSGVVDMTNGNVAQMLFGDADTSLITRRLPVKLSSDSSIAAYKAQYGQAAYEKARDYQLILSALSVDAAGDNAKVAVNRLKQEITNNAGQLPESRKESLYRDARRLMADAEINKDIDTAYGAALFGMTETKRNSLDQELSDDMVIRFAPSRKAVSAGVLDANTLVDSSARNRFTVSYQLNVNGTITDVTGSNIDLTNVTGRAVLITILTDNLNPNRVLRDRTVLTIDDNAETLALTLSDVDASGTHTLSRNTTASFLRNLTPKIITISGNTLTVREDGVARIEMRKGMNSHVAVFEVRTSRNAPNISWAYDSVNTEAVATSSDVAGWALEYDGNSYAMSDETRLPVDEYQLFDATMTFKVNDIAFAVPSVQNLKDALNQDALTQFQDNLFNSAYPTANLFANLVGLPSAIANSGQLELYRGELRSVDLGSVDALFNRLDVVNTYATSLNDLNSILSGGDSSAISLASLTNISRLENVIDANLDKYREYLITLTPPSSLEEVQEQVDSVNALDNPFATAARIAGHSNAIDAVQAEDHSLATEL
ncbi:hypothetical protein, partial [Photobacterium leiognathi]|uniref:hypothetical protein n=1 Tax=Photobacterium leiognathi TaxID=553611 RepID=UPI001E50DAFD